MPDVQPPEPSTPALPSRLQRLQQSALVQRPLTFYERHERFAPLLFFFGGVTWDAATLRRIDAWFDNVFLLVYLAALGGLILVAALVESERLVHPWLQKHRGWLPGAIQFFMGALFSAYTVFYLQSASLTSTSFFLFLLVGLLVANEFIHRRLINLYLLFTLYYFAAFSFFVFFVPVVVKAMHYGTFLLGGLLSLGLVGGMLWFLFRRGVFEQRRQVGYAFGLVLALFGLLNLFYVKDWMPPVPLALRHGGIYHEVRAAGPVYELWYARPPWYRFWQRADVTFRRAEGEPVYCFAAVFAPTELKKGIYHEWRYYDEARGTWITTDRISYRIVGGRDNGYRGYTVKRQLQPGRWRVDVRTADDHTLGRIRFEVVPAEAPADGAPADDLVMWAYE